MPLFERYIGIDYSGAETPTASLSALCVRLADRVFPPREVVPPAGPRKYWTRRGMAEWLSERIREPKPTLIGIDHAFSFPLEYFREHELPLDWGAFLDDFQRHWPTDGDLVYVDFVRDGNMGKGTERMGDPSWLRLTELWAPTAKSVFRFDVQGQVAKSTHAGLPWLKYLRDRHGDRIHFWPFDGWDIPKGRSVIAEIYPSLWMRRWPREGRNGDQHAAYCTAAWLRRVDMDDSLARFITPPLESEERKRAGIEGWILGVT